MHGRSWPFIASRRRARLSRWPSSAMVRSVLRSGRLDTTMLANFRRVVSESSPRLRRKIAGIYVALIAINLLLWALTLAASLRYPLLIGYAIAAFGFGLRHAVDADHISAIDNVTRKLMQE